MLVDLLLYTKEKFFISQMLSNLQQILQRLKLYLTTRVSPIPLNFLIQLTFNPYFYCLAQRDSDPEDVPLAVEEDLVPDGGCQGDGELDAGEEGERPPDEEDVAGRGHVFLEELGEEFRTHLSQQPPKHLIKSIYPINLSSIKIMQRLKSHEIAEDFETLMW